MWNKIYMIIPIITGATKIVAKGLKEICKSYQENIHYTHYERQLY